LIYGTGGLDTVDSDVDGADPGTLVLRDAELAGRQLTLPSAEALGADSGQQSDQVWTGL